MNEMLSLFETNLIEQLTATQGSPEWFNQRQFRITGTSAFALWKRLAHLALAGSGGFEMSDSLRYTCKMLSLKHSNEPIPNENVADRVFNNEELLQLSVSELKDICQQKRVPISGNKTTLINRILQGGGSQHSNAEHPVLELLLEKWFMSPFASSTSMRRGTLNESNVLLKLASFLDDHSELTVIDYKEYGLLCAKDTFYAAFSPDGIVVVKHDEELHQGNEAFTNFLAMVEIKSKCTNVTVQKEKALAARYGAFRTVLAFADIEEFKQCVPEACY
jgi:SAP domain